MTATTETTPHRLGSGDMFDQIAPRYDLMNRLISLGLDKRWRTRLVRSLAPTEPRRLLDVATGTADVLQALRKAYPECEVVGLDPSAEMLRYGVHKLDARSWLVRGDGQRLPFPDDHFDGCCISFGIRNVPDRPQCVRDMVRVTRPGGRVSILELSEPRGWGPLALASRFHMHQVVPRLGAALSGATEYKYLSRSIAAFPPATEFAALLEECGLREVQVQPMNFGVAHLYVGVVGGDA
ncbi:MAG: ubiquinone/menaquinone biosynthesis methyltransferase [Planctomycetota bacterium]